MPSRFNLSDRLAIVLFCIGAVLAIVLFLIEKTPLAVGLLLVAMLGFLIFPILHFVKDNKSRSIFFTLTLIVLGIFGLVVWPKGTSDSQRIGYVSAPTLSPSPLPQPVPSTTPKTTQRAALGNEKHPTQPNTTPIRPERPHKKKKIQPPNNSTPASVQQQNNSGGTNIQQGTTGNNSPIISAPNGIAIGGGNVNNPTVNNYAPPERRISPSQRTELISALKGKKLKVAFGYLLNVPDSQQYAEDLQEAFKEVAGIDVQDDVRAMSARRNMWSGVEVEFRGPLHPQETIDISYDTPEGIVISSLLKAHVNVGAVHSDVNQPEGLITIVVGKP